MSIAIEWQWACYIACAVFLHYLHDSHRDSISIAMVYSDADHTVSLNLDLVELTSLTEILHQLRLSRMCQQIRVDV